MRGGKTEKEACEQGEIIDRTWSDACRVNLKTQEKLY